MVEQLAQGGPLRVGIGGALGRMGLAVAEVLATRRDAVLVAGVRQAGGRRAGAGRRRTLSDAGAALAGCDVLIDFSTPQASARRSPSARRAPAVRRW